MIEAGLIGPAKAALTAYRRWRAVPADQVDRAENAWRRYWDEAADATGVHQWPSMSDTFEWQDFAAEDPIRADAAMAVAVALWKVRPMLRKGAARPDDDLWAGELERALAAYEPGTGPAAVEPWVTGSLTRLCKRLGLSGSNRPKLRKLHEAGVIELVEGEEPGGKSRARIIDRSRLDTEPTDWPARG